VSDHPDIAVEDDTGADHALVTRDGADAGTPAGDAAAAPPRKRPFDRGLFIASMVIAAGLLLIVYGFTAAITGDDGIDRPEAIESVQPVENAIQVLQQERIVVDLEPGYEAVLIIDGVELPTTVIGQSDVDPAVQAQPGQQIDLPTTAVFDPGNAVISFQPVDGALIESLEEGTREATVRFWKTEDGPQQAREYSWTFEVV
jgi:hypothetical protein